MASERVAETPLAVFRLWSHALPAFLLCSRFEAAAPQSARSARTPRDSAPTREHPLRAIGAVDARVRTGRGTGAYEVQLRMGGGRCAACPCRAAVVAKVGVC
jgi:hypothetical protein